jgi:hypothetical protein
MTDNLGSIAAGEVDVRLLEHSCENAHTTLSHTINVLTPISYPDGS